MDVRMGAVEGVLLSMGARPITEEEAVSLPWETVEGLIGNWISHMRSAVSQRKTPNPETQKSEISKPRSPKPKTSQLRSQKTLTTLKPKISKPLNPNHPSP